MRNRGESISAIVSAISAGEKGQNSLKPDKIVVIKYRCQYMDTVHYVAHNTQSILLYCLCVLCNILSTCTSVFK